MKNRSQRKTKMYPAGTRQAAAAEVMRGIDRRMQRDAVRHVRKKQPTGCPMDVGNGTETIASGAWETRNAGLPCRQRVDGCKDSTFIPHTVHERLRYATVMWARIFLLERWQCYLRMHGLCFRMGGCKTRL